MLIDTNRLLKVLILEFFERLVRYNETVLGSDGKEFKPCLTQMVRRYIKEANIFKNNALNKIKL